MRKTECFAGNRRVLPLAGVVLVGIAVVVGLWIGVHRKQSESGSHAGVPAEAGGNVPETRKPQGGEKFGISGGGLDETVVSGSHRQPLQFQAKEVEPAAVLEVLAGGKQTVDERVRQLQGMRGISFSKEEREAALAFLAGKNAPEGMGKGSMHWLANELLSA